MLAARDDGAGPERRVLLGAWAAPLDGDRSAAAIEGALAEVERLLGRPLAIAHFYYRFDADPIDGREERAIARGAIPLVSWNDTYPADVLSGAQDARIRAAARRFGALPGRVLLRFGWEMDRPGDTSTDAAGYIRMWRHVRGLFAEEGADRVEWIWCPTDWAFNPKSGRRPLDWYPGDDAVDWLCADGYNFYPENSTWTSFETTLGDFYRWAAPKGKPIMIGETGVMEDPADPARKGAWYGALAETVRCRWPEVDAVVLFDEEKHEQGVVRDWRIATSATSTAGARAAFADPVLGGAGPPQPCPEADE